MREHRQPVSLRTQPLSQPTRSCRVERLDIGEDRSRLPTASSVQTTRYSVSDTRPGQRVAVLPRRQPAADRLVTDQSTGTDIVVSAGIRRRFRRRIIDIEQGALVLHGVSIPARQRRGKATPSDGLALRHAGRANRRAVA